MNDIFRDILDSFVLVYLDDIVIYSTSASSHIRHVRQVLRRLTFNGLYAKAEKYEFGVRKTEFLGFIISADGISMASTKVSAVTAWPEPKKVRDIHQFIGFANFHRRFIPGYSRISNSEHDVQYFDVLLNFPFEALDGSPHHCLITLR